MPSSQQSMNRLYQRLVQFLQVGSGCVQQDVCECCDVFMTQSKFRQLQLKELEQGRNLRDLPKGKDAELIMAQQHDDNLALHLEILEYDGVRSQGLSDLIHAACSC